MINNKVLFPLLLAAFFSFSCGSSKYVTLSVTQPAEVTLPSDVNTILLIDRTKFNNETLNVFEGILTGELPADDRVAAQEALNSLKNMLGYSPRFSVKILPDRFDGNSLTGAFPPQLSWNVIDQLCKKNNAEVVVSFEIFDSDFIVTNGKRIKKRQEGQGEKKREVEYTEYYAQGVGSVKMGIRTYYNTDKTILDQKLIEKNNRWEGTGTSFADAAAALISKSSANKYLAKDVGADYAYKISPMPISITRSFYGKIKSVPEVSAGTRHAEVAQWQEAINKWKSGLPKANKKDAGKIAYNIAVGYEVLGEYGTALTWAQDSYIKYENKKGRDYTGQLQQRINEERVLKEQMEH
jgi:hypothetical protein